MTVGESPIQASVNVLQIDRAFYSARTPMDLEGDRVKTAVLLEISEDALALVHILGGCVVIQVSFRDERASRGDFVFGAGDGNRTRVLKLGKR